MSYQAPLKDMQFVIEHLAGLANVQKLPGFADYDADTAQAVLEESAKFCQDVLSPLNWSGDQQPSTWNQGEVKASPGFKEALQQYAEGGWQGITHPVEYGGQGFPKLIATGCNEMLQASNLSFALCPLLTDGAIEALMTAASEDQKQKYVPRMISGEWTGTMNLTEPQAGSDLAAVRTRAEPQADGTYKIFGTKIYITWGEHDMTDNIIHLVLARLPDAPAGVKGISLFVVPKFLVQNDGSLGARNDVQCVSIEHKLGIKASATAVLQFGDNGGAVGELLGEPNRGLEYMFIMMNAARFGVGIQGVAVADRAYQQAVAYAKDRVQSRDVAGSASPVSIIHHPDVKRMLLTIKAQTEAARAVAYVGAAHSDVAHFSDDEQARQSSLAIYEYLVPVIKGHSTELSVDSTSLGVQVHGGMGFIEETGAAQHFRDSRILPIYEGTTAIQANDFVGRKTLRDQGKVAKLICSQIAQTEQDLAAHADADCVAMKESLQTGRLALERVIDFLLHNAKGDPRVIYSAAVPYLRLAGVVLGGWQMARALMMAQSMRADDPAFYDGKIVTCNFYAAAILPQAQAYADAACLSASAINQMDLEWF